MTRIIYPFLLVIGLASKTQAQDLLDYQLRLEPVWSRVADALGEPGSVESAEFSPNGRYIISGTKYDNSVIVWRTSDGVELWRQYTEQEIERASWSADNQYVAAASEDYLVTVYDAKSGQVLHKISHNQGIDGLVWSNSGLLLASGEERSKNEKGAYVGYVRIFSMPGAKEVATINYGATCNELFFTSDDRYLLAAGHAGVSVYRTEDWKLMSNLKLVEGREVYTAASFSPDDQYIVAASNFPERGKVIIWDWKENKAVKTFNHLAKKVESVSWHPNGNYISYAGHSPYIYTYRVSDILNYSNDRIRIANKTWAGDHAEYIDFNADGSFLVSAHQNGLIKLWVWMGEEPDLNEKLHSAVKKKQAAAGASN